MLGSFRFVPRAACLAWVCITAACSETEDSPAAALSTFVDAGQLPMLLLPVGPRAQVGQPFRIQFHRESGLDGGAVARLETAFDPCMARVGGHQSNMLQPDVVDGRAGLTVTMPDEGNAMVGLSTLPQVARWGTERVRFSQHVKSLFVVARTWTGVPVSSAAVSYRFGLRLEIVPMVDPIPLLPDEELPMQVRFDGSELAGAELVFSWRPRGEDATSHEIFRGRTDAAGTLVVPIQKAGRYVATVVHREVAAGDTPEVLWSALTFMIGEK